MEQTLYHHGILGQKWGIRRFQNKDGTLTAEGKKRHSIIDKARILREANSYGNSEANKNRLRDDKELEKKQRSIEKDYNRFVNNELTPKQEKMMYEKYKKYDLHGVGDLNSGDLWDNAIADADPRYNRQIKSSVAYAKQYTKDKYGLDYDKLQKDTDLLSLGVSVIGTLGISLLALTASGEIDWKR